MDTRFDAKGNKLPPCICSSCGVNLDAATPAGHEDRPKIGDITICLCGQISVFGDDMRLRQPTSDEMYDLAADKNILKTMAAIDLVRKMRK